MRYHKTNITIIGRGIVGLLTALTLSKKYTQITLIENNINDDKLN